MTPLDKLEFVDDDAPPNATLDTLVLAITSSNQSHSRYNPLPLHVRFAAVREFAKRLPVQYKIFNIPHFQGTDRFIEYLLREIENQTDGQAILTPANTVVLCSTEELIPMYRQHGFKVLPAELDLKTGKYLAPRPFDLVKLAGESTDWESNTVLQTQLSAATREVWKDVPGDIRHLQWLFKEPLLSEQGSLTKTRNYFTYARSLDNPTMIEIKYKDIKDFIVGDGIIVDEGCAAGSLLARIAVDYRDADFRGIDISAELIARCEEMQRAGIFGRAYIWFHQRNVLEKLFEDDTVATTICNSTTHELWSYVNRGETVYDYLAKKFAQTRNGGRLIIRDVVGPENKEQEVYMRCNTADGVDDPAPYQAFQTPEGLAGYLDSLSTSSRFRRFAQDFRSGRPTGQVHYRTESVGGEGYFVLSLKDAVEFMSKKNYTDNWQSELNEEFAFWSLSEWKNALNNAGFTVLENAVEPAKGSRAFTNPWFVEKSWQGRVTLYAKNAEGGLEQMAWPVTNMVMVGEKR